MANRFSTLLLVLFLTTLCAIPAAAQFGAIEGDVKGADGQPAVGALIVIDRTDMKGQYKVPVKDKKTGHYYYGGLPLGMYKVTVKINDKDMDSVNGVKVGLGDAQKVNFDLKEAAMRAQAASVGMAVPQAQPGGGAAPKLSKEEQAKVEEAVKKNEEAKAKNAKLTGGFNAGMAAMQANNFDEAIKQFQSAGEADPTQSAVWAQLGEAYSRYSKTQSGDERKASIAKGVESYQKAVALKADDGALHHNMGLMMVNGGDVDGGVAELQKAAQLDPTNASKYYFNLGAVLTNSNKADEATVAFQNSIKADPNNAEAYYQMATALMGKAALDPKTGKITPAPGTIEGYQKYLELKPDGPNADTCKQMIATLGGTISTQVKIKDDSKTPAKKKP
jgi:tetratricopeptide (TPR) repeat protein